jgi:selenocysteine-specific elongation factor
VPGHERFVKNMLAGVGGIDVVMLVIAADESVMPQTREHLEICSLLRIKQGFTVLTKIDATDRDLVDLAEIEVHEFLEGTFLDGAPIVRVSSLTGEGIPRLLETLADYAARAAPKDASRVFRLPIDRAFTMKGFGTVVSGTLVAGRIHRDQDVELLPARQPARVRGIQVHGAAVDEAVAGQRTALNLQRVELTDVERGMILASPGVFMPTNAFDVHLELLASAAAPIVRRKRVRFHVGTAEIMGYVVLLGQDVLEPGQSAAAQIRLERPTFALPGDRFIIRQYSPMTTIGGGEILDARPRKHRRTETGVKARLEALGGAPIPDRILAIVQDAGVHAVEAADVVARLGILPDMAADHLARLVQAGVVRVVSDAPITVVAAPDFERAVEALATEVARFHQAEPLVKGIGREDLKGRVLRDAHPAVFRAAIDHLTAQKRLAVDQDVVFAYGRAVTLGGEEARIRHLLEQRYRELGLQAPAADDVIAGLHVDRSTARKIVQLMIKERVLIRINEEITVDSDAIRKLIETVRTLKAGQSRFGVKEFKDLTGLSRKFAVPLLEYLDGQRITRRVGDERVIL